jgi:hypothetical protein
MWNFFKFCGIVNPLALKDIKYIRTICFQIEKKCQTLDLLQVHTCSHWAKLFHLSNKCPGFGSRYIWIKRSRIHHQTNLFSQIYPLHIYQTDEKVSPVGLQQKSIRASYYPQSSNYGKHPGMSLKIFSGAQFRQKQRCSMFETEPGGEKMESEWAKRLLCQKQEGINYWDYNWQEGIFTWALYKRVLLPIDISCNKILQPTKYHIMPHIDGLMHTWPKWIYLS